MTVLSFDSLPAIGPLLARSVMRTLRPPRHATNLADVRARVASVPCDVPRLAAYVRLCGFGLSDIVPATWLHVQTFPLQVAVMARPEFGYPLVGIVHVSNAMTSYRPVKVTEALALQVRTGELWAHRRGAVVELVGEALAGDELVWRGSSRYLIRGVEVDGAPPAPSAGPDVAAGEWPEPTQVWRLPADLGRRYARVSGDVNPIHTTPLVARLAGFRRPLVHGMWSHARALAGLAGRLPAAYDTEVAFTRPVLLPGRVGLSLRADGPVIRFALLGRESAVHLTGTVTPRG